jgi:hypothetical protein
MKYREKLLIGTIALAALAFAMPAVAKEPAVHVVIDPQPAIDGSVEVQANTSTVLFGGVTPANGFSVQAFGAPCAVNDHGPASLTPVAGFDFEGEIYTTPLGYKPIGPVSVLCETPASVTARAW